MMKFRRVGVSAILLAGLFSASVFAEDVVLQPRVTVGQLDYKFDYYDSVIGTNNGYAYAHDGFKVADKVSFAGAGLTANYRSFFFDLSGQWSSHGTVHTSQYIGPFPGVFVPNTVVGVGHNHLLDFEFNRNELNATLGWAMTPNLSLFLGYKNSTLNLTNTLTPILTNVTFYDIYLIGTQYSKFKFDGPFVGATYSAPVSRWGALAVQSSVVFLTGKLKNHLDGFAVYSQPAPPYLVQFDPAILGLSGSANGRSTGLNIGLSWTGNLAWISDEWSSVGYTIGLDRSEYKFGNNNTQGLDYAETITRARLDLRYRFNL